MRPSHRVTIRCLNPLPARLSFSTSEFIEKRHTERHVRKDAVPPLYEALQDSRHEEGRSPLQRSTQGFHKNLYTYEDGVRLLFKDWRFSAWRSRRRNRLSTIGFNAITARLHRLGLDLRLKNILYGMQSMCDNPAALKQYLRMMQPPKADDSSIALVFKKFFKGLAPRLRKTQQRRHLKRNERIYDQQWFNVITGLSDNESIQNNAPREQSLYSLGPGLDYRHWTRYIDAVHRILGPETACLEFRRFKNQHASQSGPGGSGINFKDWVLNPTILHLADGDDPKHAWEIVQELEAPSQVLDYRTWKALLAHPDYNRIWIPKMFPWLDMSKLENPREQMMGASAPTQLEDGLSQLEKDMGLEWNGGEAGYHTIVPNSNLLLECTDYDIE